MAIVYKAELRPSKMELLVRWLPQQAWFSGDGTALVRLGAFRFDDPDGEVGLETILVGAGSKVYQVPLTYRGAPLDGAEAFLIGTMEHSVLGHRWVYDATADPVYVGELAAALLTGKPQAVENREVDGVLETLPMTAHLHSTGTAASVPALSPAKPTTADAVTTVPAGPLALRIARELDLSGVLLGDPVLTVTWAGQEAPVQLASLGPAAGPSGS
ncbi:CG0192-related protein [Specibacter sp. RAF43]|uniref:CG0192-related protein n=1 Tax=Specibacter sp. RAF43 TaxID=3233057 RepID=UPI003F9526C8